MRLLSSDILPVGIEEGQATISETFVEQIADSDSVEIAVGYVSKASLEELDALVEAHHIQHISLVIGNLRGNFKNFRWHSIRIHGSKHRGIIPHNVLVFPCSINSVYFE